MAEYSDNEFVKLNRKILNWQWYPDPCTRDLFIHCILRANWKAGDWKGFHYERGQFITSITSLATELGYSAKNIRTALNHLKSTGELADWHNNKFRVITVLNYDRYQVGGKQDGKQPASNRQATGKQPATDKEYKEGKEEKKKNKYSADFESFWSCYPRRKEKAKAFRNFQTRLKEGYVSQDIIKAAEEYATECRQMMREEKFIKLPSTFLGPDKPFEDYINAAPSTGTKPKVASDGRIIE